MKKEVKKKNKEYLSIIKYEALSRTRKGLKISLCEIPQNTLLQNKSCTYQNKNLQKKKLQNWIKRIKLKTDQNPKEHHA